MPEVSGEWDGAHLPVDVSLPHLARNAVIKTVTRTPTG